MSTASYTDDKKSHRKGHSTLRQKVIVTYLILVLVFANGTSTAYGIFAGITLCFFLLSIPLILYFRVKLGDIQWLDVVPLLFLFVWLYGFALGYAKNNQLNYIVQNFAGLVLFASYYFILSSKISRELVYRCILLCGSLVLISSICAWLLAEFTDVDIYHDPAINFFFGAFQGGTSTGQVRILSAGQIVIFPLFCVTAARVFFGERPRTNIRVLEFIFSQRSYSILLLVLILFVLLYMAASKGFVLALAFVFAILLSKVVFSRRPSGNFVNYVLIAIILSSIAVWLDFSGYFNIVQNLFSDEDASNQVRYDQLAGLLGEINLFGHGLGAVVPGLIRDNERPYGFELEYLNYAHKFGVFSLLLIYAYVYCIWRAISGLHSKSFDRRYALAALGCFCYLIPSLGNPFLTEPNLVLLHCAGMYLLRFPSKRSVTGTVAQQGVFRGAPE